jgi:hypothetical protein
MDVGLMRWTGAPMVLQTGAGAVMVIYNKYYSFDKVGKIEKIMPLTDTMLGIVLKQKHPDNWGQLLAAHARKEIGE